MSNSSKRLLGLGSVAVLLTILVGSEARVVAQTPVVWQFEDVAQGNLIPGCVSGMTLAGFEYGPDGRPVLAWREENGCGGKPRIHWTRQDAGAWTQTEFLSPRRQGGGGEGDYAHQLAVSPSDGHPFLIYADVGDNNSINTYQTDLGTDPKGDLLPDVEGLVGPQSCAGVNYSLAFGPSDVTPQWSTGLANCSGFGPIRLNGTSINNSVYNPRSSLAIGADGTRHVLWINDVNVFYTRWFAGAPAPDTTVQLFTNNTSNRGEGKITIDGAGTLHALVRGPDISSDFDYGAIVYFRSTDGGKNWSPWEYVDPHDNPKVQNPSNNNTDMSLAVDADGVPAVTFWRGNSELWYARRDPGGTWTQQLIFSVPFTNPTRTNQLRFDPDGRPVVAFYDPIINQMRLARPVPAGVVVPVDVAVTAGVTPGVVPAGSAITYTLKVTNNGATNLDRVVLTNRLGDGVTLVSASPAAGTDGRWTFALTSGASTTVTLFATAPFAKGWFVDVASVSTDIEDDHREDNAATAGARVAADQCFLPDAGTNPACEALTPSDGTDVSVTVKATPASVVTSGIATFQIGVTNTGSVDLPGVTIDNRLAGGASFEDAAPWPSSEGSTQQYFDIGPLARGEWKWIVVRAKAPPVPGTMSAQAHHLVDSDMNGLNDEASGVVQVLPDACFVPQSSLIGRWLADGTGEDVAGGRTASLMGGATFDVGRAGKAFSLSGFATHVQVPDAPALRPAQFTIGAWANPRSFEVGSNGWDTVIAKGASGADGNMSWWLNTYWLGFAERGYPTLYTDHQGHGEVTTQSPTRLTPGQWYHLSATFDGSFARLFVNGVQVAQSAISAPLYYDTQSVPLLFGEDFQNGMAGGGGGGNIADFPGLIDDVTLHDRALSAAEIQGLFDGSSPLCPPPNHAPEIDNPGDQTSAEGAEIALPISAHDPDGDAVTYSAAGLPPGLNFDPATPGVISGHLGFLAAGDYTVMLTVRDGTATSTASFAWTVTNVACNPFAQNDSATTTEGMAIDIPVLDNDIIPAACISFGGPIFSAASQPQHGTVVLDGKVGTATYTPAPNFTGIDTFTYTITNSDGGTATATGTVTVETDGPIRVNTTAQDPLTSADCTLRQAIDAANQNLPVGGCVAGGSTPLILVPAGTYALSTIVNIGSSAPRGLPFVTRDVTIQGAGAASTIIERNAGAPVFGIFRVSFARRFTLTGVTVRGGAAARSGGAIYNDGGVVTLVDARFTGNHAIYGGAYLDVNGGSLSVTRSTFDENQAAEDGGAIFSESVAATSSTFSGNSAGQRGGALTVIDRGGNLVNVTVSGNTAGYSGGGVWFSQLGSALDLTNVTITQNSSLTVNGAGVYGTGGSLRLANAIIARNFFRTEAGLSLEDDVSVEIGSIESLGYNLLGTVVGGAIWTDAIGDQVGTAQVRIDPGLGPLAQDGGSTATHLPLPGSPALDAGNPAAPGGGTPGACPSVDQRGIARPADGTGHGHGHGVARCDIGAVEVSRTALVPEFYVTDEDTLVTGNVLDNDTASYLPHIQLTAVLVSGPAHARSFSLQPDGSFSYTPAQNFSGSDGFVYRVNDGIADSSIDGAASLDVRPINDRPVSVYDSYVTNEDTLVSGNVLDNDTDVDTPHSQLEAVLVRELGHLVSGPAHAQSFSLSHNGSFSYVPAQDYSGRDHFVYKVNDGLADSEPGTPVFIDVRPVNDLPFPVSDSPIEAHENTPAWGNVLANDIDVDTPRSQLTAVLVSGPAHAQSFVLNPNGDFFYLPAQDYTGSDGFLYKVNDGLADSEVSSFNYIHVRPATTTTTTVTSAVNPSTSGQAVTFTATVATVGAVTPEGEVSFVYVPTHTTLATIALVGGTAAFQTSGLPEGTFDVQAIFTGNGSFAGSSATLTQVVVPAAATPIRNGTPESRSQFSGVGMILPSATHGACTATLISPFIVLTAAQCLRDDSPDPVFEFSLGEGRTARVTDIRVHPVFDGADGVNLMFDVALASLDRAVAASWTDIIPATLRAGPPSPVVEATAIGFGETSAGAGSGRRTSGTLLVKGFMAGEDASFNTVPDAFLEADPGSANQMFCPGPGSGGPLFYEDQVVGVASFRFVATCAEAGPGYYVNVSRFADWIQANANELEAVIPSNPRVEFTAPATTSFDAYIGRELSFDVTATVLDAPLYTASITSAPVLPRSTLTQVTTGSTSTSRFRWTPFPRFEADGVTPITSEVVCFQGGGFRPGADSIPSDAHLCVTISIHPAQLMTLSGTLRGFRPVHPDGNRVDGDQGVVIVAPELGVDRKPRFSPGGPVTTIESESTFNEWWNDGPRTVASPFDVVLSNGLQADPRVFVFESTAFQPGHKYFSFEGHARIPYVPGDTLRFASADDLWIFINGHLVIDLGGVHPPASADVDLDSRAAELGLAAGESFTIDVFYAHRGLHDAAFVLRLPAGLESCAASGAEGRLRKPFASPLTLTVGESISGIVDVFDICGVPIAATVDDVAVTLTRAGMPPVNGLLSPEADGSVSFLVPSLTAGEWQLNVTYRGEHIQGSPFTVITENRPPVLVNPGDQLSIAGDTILPLALAASDQDGDPLTYSASNLPPGLSVTPSTGVIAGTLLPTSAGAYDVTVSAFDGALSDSKSFTWTVSTCNPLALPDAAATPQNTPADIRVLDNDIVPTACIAFGLDLSDVSQPQHGTVVFDGKLGKVTYTPATDFVGTDTFDYTITNSVGGTATATVTVTVMPVTISIGDVTAAESNSGATPFAFIVTLSNPSAETVTVHYTTADGTAAMGDDDYSGASGMLTFAPGQTSQTVVVNVAGDTKFEPAETFWVTLSSPAHATVMAGTGTGTILNDDSTPTISIGNVIGPEGNSGATVFGFAVTLSNPSAQIVTVNYATANGTATTRHGDYTPMSGTLTFAPGQTSQTVVVNVTGDTTLEPDQTFRVNLSAATNATIIVATGTGTIQNDDNHPPVAADDTAVTNEDTAVTIRVLANDSDPDANKLVVESVTSATHGVVSINASRRNLRYVPSANFNGSDSFTYTVTDGQGGSATASVNVTVTPVNDRPAADGLTLTTAEDTPITITLSGTDTDDDPLTIQFGNPPHGTIAGTPPNVVYTPDANFVGADSFTFTVNDGALTSVPARVTITVTPVNDAPFFNPIADRTVPEDTGPRTVTINGVTAGAPNESAQPVTFIATSSDLAVLPNPIITGSGATRTLSFQSAPNKNGTVLITVVADDGQSENHVFSRTFTVTVTPVNDRPVPNAMTSTGFEDNQLGIVLTASDVESDPLTFILRTHPAHGSLAGIPPNLVYTPVANYFGSDSFTFTVNDGQPASTPATVTINLAPVNDPPVAVAQNDMTPAGTPVVFTLSASDFDSPSLTYAITSGPAHGTLSGTPPQIVYTPAADYIGADSFTFTARDMQLTSLPATVSVSVGATLRYSTDITVDLGDGVIVGGDQVVEDTGVGPVTPVLSMPAHIDGYQLRADGVHLLSFDTTVSLPGGVTAGPADIVTWDGVRATVAFNAAARGIPNGANVQSVGLTGTSLLLSFDITVQLSSTLTAGPRDIVRVTGNGFQSFFAGAAAGIPDGLGIAGCHFLEASNVLLLAFDGAGMIGGVNFTKTDVLEFHRATNRWRMFWAGATSRPGLANAGIAGLWVTPATAPLITTAPLHDE